MDATQERYAKLGTPTFMLDIHRGDVLMAARASRPASDAHTAIGRADMAVRPFTGCGAASVPLRCRRSRARQ
ncbi:hypothetical protein [Streptomyces cellulosae]|uniref:Uncharacterized protein n=1 Tax=Streptomyces cellulosae TaxID=1968 RepID=A0ABW7Y9W4_STRCE